MQGLAFLCLIPFSRGWSADIPGFGFGGETRYFEKSHKSAINFLQRRTLPRAEVTEAPYGHSREISEVTEAPYGHSTTGLSDAASKLDHVLNGLVSSKKLGSDFPPVWSPNVQTAEAYRRTAKENGKAWNKEMMAYLQSNQEDMCQAMADAGSWFWTEDRVQKEVFNGEKGEVPISTDQKREAHKWWEGQSELNAIWRNEACKDLSEALLDEKCSSIKNVKPAYRVVCQTEGSSSSSSSSTCCG